MNRPRLLICDEPTSALDPVGRKEILDLLLAVREQTTVLFSTHILSDVERICTDIALLHEGKVDIQGKLSEIRTQYRRDEYLVETDKNEGMHALQTAFPEMRQTGRNQLAFSEKDYAPGEVLRFVADHAVPIVKIEREEPTLESLFVEVVEK